MSEVLPGLQSSSGKKKNSHTHQTRKGLESVFALSKRDKAYYENKEKVYADLEGFAKAQNKTAIQLCVKYIGDITCQNGDKISWRQYLCDAGIALCIAQDKTEVLGKKGQILQRLKEIAGVMNEVKDKRDKTYYEDKKKVYADLAGFAKEQNKTIQGLNTTSKLNIKCQNGEKISWGVYLSDAGVALKLAKNNTAGYRKLLLILQHLKETAGAVIRDKSYYTNTSKVYKDLLGFAKQQKKTIKTLASTNEGNIRCQNGEVIPWLIYLCDAGGALGLVENNKMARSNFGPILQRLKEISGAVNIIEVPRNKQYYTNKEKVYADLEGFAKQQKKTIQNLTSHDTGYITCQNGEKISWGVYACNAGVALGIAKNNQQAQKKKGLILKSLKEISGAVNIIKVPRDKKYYTNTSNLYKDLLGFAKQQKKTVETLTVSTKGNITCQNGEKVSWSVYLSDAGVALGFADNKTEIRKNMFFILQKLKEITGFVKIIEVPRNEKYYTNTSNLYEDLLGFAKQQKKTIQDLTIEKVGKITCQNGEMISWGVYLCDAGVALGLVKNNTEAYVKRGFILKKLKEIVGVKVGTIEFSDIETQRYENIAHTLGWKAMLEVLLVHHPKWVEIGFDKLEKVIGGYLGAVKNPESGLNAVMGIHRVDLQVILNIPMLKQSLIHTIKNEFLFWCIQRRKAHDFPNTNYKVLYQNRLDEITPTIKNCDPEINSLMQYVDVDMQDLFSNTYRADTLLSSLDETGRMFPGFEQMLNVQAFLKQRRLLVADDMGLGKSGTAICAKECLGKKVKTALITCPANMILDWKERLTDKKDEMGKPKGYFIEGKAPAVLVIKSTEDCMKDFSAYDYVLLSTSRLNEKYVEQIIKNEFQMVIVDEVHEMKNLTGGIRSTNLLRITDKMNDAGRVMTLSGTPIPNRINDIALHLRILYPHEFDGIDNQSIVKSMIQQDKLNVGLKLRMKTARKRLTDWIKMPEKKELINIIEPFAFENDVTMMVLQDENLTATQKIHLLRKLYIAPQSVNQAREGIVSEKMRVLSDNVRSYLEKFDKVIIILNDFIEDIIRSDDTVGNESEEIIQSEGYIVEYIKQQLTIGGVLNNTELLTYHGNIQQDERKLIQKKINNQGGKTVLFLSGNAAKVGIDLSGANVVIMYNHPRTKADMDQQLARIYRVGLKHSIIVEHLITKGTVESGIRSFIHAKEAVTQKMLDGKEILSDAERNIIIAESITDISGKHHPDQEFAQYYYSQKEQLYQLFTMHKGIGEDKFIDSMKKITKGGIMRGEAYASLYSGLGRRNYQYNANRLNNTIIDQLIEKSNLEKNALKILDIGSASQILMETADNDRKKTITSIDVNLHHFPSGNDVDALLQQPAFQGDFSKGEYFWGSFTKTLRDDMSYDIINCSLARHYTNLNEKRNIYDRIEALIEWNRVLRPGGYVLINEIYSLQFANIEDLKPALLLCGFEVIEELTGKVESTYDATYASQILVLKKVSSSKSLQELLKLQENKQIFIQGLTLTKTKENGINNQSKILDSFTIGNKQYAIKLNQQDQNLKNEEEKAHQMIGSLKELYKTQNHDEENPILNVPEKVLHSNGMFSFLYNNKSHEIVRRVARKLSDGSFIFVN